MPDIERSKESLGFRPRVSLSDGLKFTLTYYRDRIDRSGLAQTALDVGEDLSHSQLKAPLERILFFEPAAGVHPGRLMSNRSKEKRKWRGRLNSPSHSDPKYFTLEGYRKILVRALNLNYHIVSFRGFEVPTDRPVLLLRHDLDRPLKAAELFGQIEAELGVTSTFFVQTACDFYNLLSRDSRGIIEGLATEGHEIGLHYEAERYLGELGGRHLVSDLRLLEDFSGQPVVSASQHIPIDGDRISLVEHVKNEAYESRFTEQPMNYISDSLMVWRQATPHDLLDSKASFQFLSHPDTWMSDYPNMDDALSAMMDHEIEGVRARYAGLARFYRRLLQERRERDKNFRKRRSEPAKEIGNGRDSSGAIRIANGEKPPDSLRSTHEAASN